MQLWNDETLDCPYISNWVFFVDDMVAALWYHPCRYIFVDVETGEYQIINAEIYPENKDSEFELISGLPYYEPVYLPPNPGPPREPREPNEHLYAVIICGADGTPFWYSTSALYCTLIDAYGYTKDNIIIHYAEGYSNCTIHGNDLDGDDIQDDIDHSAYIDTIHTTFQYLEGILGPDDQLFVVINSHGGTEGNKTSYICLPKEDLYDYELAEFVENIECANMIFLMQNCFSGGFIDDLTDYQTYNVKCENRVIHTACDYDDLAFLECHITAIVDSHYFTYGEMLYYWISAARGYYPVTEQPWLDSYEVGSFPFDSISTMIDHPPDYNPDDPAYGGNGDDFIQMEEAFDYTNNWNTWSPDTTIYYGGYPGYYCPYPDWPDEEDFPQQYYNIGFEDDLLSLFGLGGSITHTQTVSGNYTFVTPLTIGPEVILTIDDSSKFSINDSVSVTLFGRSLVEVTNGSEFQLKAGSSLYGTEHTVWEDPATGERYDTWEEAYQNIPNLGAEHAIPGDRIVVNSNGSINADGLDDNPIIISGVDNNSWDGFELSDFSQNQFSYCNISNISHIYVNNSNLGLNNSTYSNCGQISAVDNSYLSIQECLIDSISACPIYCCESKVDIFNSTIRDNMGTGVYVYLPSDTLSCVSANLITINRWGIHVVDAPMYCINNTIIANTSHGFVSYGAGGIPILAGNTIADNDGLEVAGLYQWPDITSHIQTWGPNIIYSHDNGGVDHYLLAGPVEGNDCRGNNIDISDTTRFLPFYSSYIFDGEKPPEKILYEEGVVQITDGEYESAKVKMKDIVDYYTETETAVSALQWLMYLEKFSGQDYAGLRDYIETIDDVYPNLERVKYNTTTSTYMAEADYLTAIDRLEDILTDPPSVEDSILAYIDQGYCYLKLDEQGGKAAPVKCTFKPTCFEEFVYVSQNLTRNLLDKAIPTIEPSTTDFESFALYQNYPNPMRTLTTISFSIPKDAKNSELKIYNIKGQLVKQFSINYNQSSIVWDGKDENGKQLGSGIYFYKLDTGKKSITKKMLLLR